MFTYILVVVASLVGVVCFLMVSRLQACAYYRRAERRGWRVTVDEISRLLIYTPSLPRRYRETLPQRPFRVDSDEGHGDYVPIELMPQLMNRIQLAVDRANRTLTIQVLAIFIPAMMVGWFASQ